LFYGHPYRGGRANLGLQKLQFTTQHHLSETSGPTYLTPERRNATGGM
jgi:hypothetical protein